jgi:hypothetical protein
MPAARLRSYCPNGAGIEPGAIAILAVGDGMREDAWATPATGRRRGAEPDAPLPLLTTRQAQVWTDIRPLSVCRAVSADRRSE